MIPKKMTMHIETLIEIAMSVGAAGISYEDSRNLVTDILEWANEFEKKHKSTAWGETHEFIEEVDKFSTEKIKEVIDNGTATEWKDKVLVTIEEGVVQGVSATSPNIRVAILDYDKQAQTDIVLLSEWTENILVCGNDFHEVLYRGKKLTDNEREAQRLMKEINI